METLSTAPSYAQAPENHDPRCIRDQNHDRHFAVNESCYMYEHQNGCKYRRYPDGSEVWSDKRETRHIPPPPGYNNDDLSSYVPSEIRTIPTAFGRWAKDNPAELEKEIEALRTEGWGPMRRKYTMVEHDQYTYVLDWELRDEYKSFPGWTIRMGPVYERSERCDSEEEEEEDCWEPEPEDYWEYEPNEEQEVLLERLEDMLKLARGGTKMENALGSASKWARWAAKPPPESPRRLQLCKPS